MSGYNHIETELICSRLKKKVLKQVRILRCRLSEWGILERDKEGVLKGGRGILKKMG